MVLGPEMRVNRKGRSVGFSRAQDGSVIVTYYHAGEPAPGGSVKIDAAGWAGVLAHCSAAGHDAPTFTAALSFHHGHRTQRTEIVEP